MGNFQVQPMPHCDDCLALSSHWEECKQCANCHYGTKVLDGRPTLACFEKNFQPPGQPSETPEPTKAGDEYHQKDNILLKGQEPLEQDLWVIPQYPLWDPQPTGLEHDNLAGGQVFPYQINSEPLSNEAWVKAYKAAAPRIQSLMDDIAGKLKTWGPSAPQTKCSEPLEERALKAVTAKVMCRKMQELQATLAPGHLGTFPRLFRDKKLRCQHTQKDTCSKLNCYVNDETSSAVAAIKSRDAECKNELLEKSASKASGKKHQLGSGGEISVKDLMKEEEAPFVPEEPSETGEKPKTVQQAMPLLALGLRRPRALRRASSSRLRDFLCATKGGAGAGQ